MRSPPQTRDEKLTRWFDGNRTVSLGKYGSFPSNLIIQRPYHVTYELQDKGPDETFSRLRIVPASELYVDVFADEASINSSSRQDESAAVDDPDRVTPAADGVEYSLVDNETGSVVMRTNRDIIDDNARQTLTPEEIQVLKKDSIDAGKDLIKQLLLSHTGIDQKTTFSLAKYKLMKERKFLRRFTVLPLDVSMFGNFALHEKDSLKILEMREEMLGLVGCWGNVHFGGEDRFLVDDQPYGAQSDQTEIEEVKRYKEPEGVRYLVVDDTGGLLVAAMAERMGILYPEEKGEEESHNTNGQQAEAENPQGSTTRTESQEAALSIAAGTASSHPGQSAKRDAWGNIKKQEETTEPKPATALTTSQPKSSGGPRPNKKPRHHGPRKSDFYIPFSTTNTMTLVHTNGQPNLTALNYWGFDNNSPNPPPHPLVNHLLPLSWLQLLEPSLDSVYSSEPPSRTSEEMASWKPNRRGNYHRKRRRWARTRYIVDSAQAGGFSGLVVASTMDPVSVIRPLLPLLTSGSPVAIYCQAIEPLARLADCFSVGRRGAFVGASRPPGAVGKTPEELERWEGTEDFPINPTLLQGCQVQTSRARKWQVLPGRTHPFMTARGGAEGYVFTAWRSKPAEGRIEARGKYRRGKEKKNAETPAAAETPATDMKTEDLKAEDMKAEA